MRFWKKTIKNMNKQMKWFDHPFTLFCVWTGNIHMVTGWVIQDIKVGLQGGL